MPALVYCGRRWSLASDDFVVIGATSALLSLLSGVGYSLGAAWVAGSKGSCDPSSGTSSVWAVEAYVYGAVAVSVLHVVTGAGVGLTALRGSPMTPSARSGIGLWLTLWGGAKLAHLGWAIGGTVWTAKGEDGALGGCLLPLLQLLVAGAWVSILVDMMALAGCVQCVGASYTQLDELRAFRKSPAYVAANRSRLALIGCLGCVDVDGDPGLVYGDAAVLLSRVFQDADVVQTDIVLGLKLTHAAHKAAAHAEREARAMAKGWGPGRVREHQFLPSAVELDSEDADDARLVEEIDYYAGFAVAVYGWPLYAHTRCLRCGCGALVGCACADPCCADKYLYSGVGVAQPVSVGDNPCGYNVHTMRRFLVEHFGPAADDIQILYSNYDNCVFQPNYMVAVDHGRETVVIAVRGTLSVDDAFTDVTAFPSALDPDEWFAAPFSGTVQTFGGDGSGVRESGFETRSSLDGFSWTEESSSSRSRAGGAGGRAGDSELSGWSDEEQESVLDAMNVSKSKINPDDEVLAGETELYAHVGMVRSAKWIRADMVSRGLMSQLKTQLDMDGSFCRFDVVVTGHSLGAGTGTLLACLLRSVLPRVRAVVYSTPAVGSPAFGERVKPFVTSVILGKDCVPRLSERTGHILRDELADNLFRSFRPKVRAMCISPKAAPAMMDGAGDTTGWEPERVELYEDWQAALAQTHEVTGMVAEPPEFAPPGDLIHMVQLPGPSEVCCSKIRGRKWDYAMVRVTDSQDFGHIVVSPMMVADHMPWNVAAAVRSSVAEFRGRAGAEAGQAAASGGDAV